MDTFDKLSKENPDWGYYRMIKTIHVNYMPDGSECIKVFYHMTTPLSKDAYL